MSAIIAGGLSKGEASAWFRTDRASCLAPPSTSKRSGKTSRTRKRRQQQPGDTFAEAEKRAVRAQAEIAAAEADLKASRESPSPRRSNGQAPRARVGPSRATQSRGKQG